MDDAAIAKAATLLAAARRTRTRIDRLPDDCRPMDIEEAFRVQEQTVRLLDEDVAGWKVGPCVQGRTSYGVVLASRVLQSGGEVRADDVPMLGMEAEIAFRFVADAGPRERAYSLDEIADRVVACAAVEIVDSRYLDYVGTPVIERVADLMSNGALVLGPPNPQWRGIDFAALPVTLEVDGHVVAQQTGGHADGDPLLPAVRLANALRTRDGVRAGRVMTTGTFTGLHFAAAGQRVRAIFDGFGTAEVRVLAGG